MSVICPECGTPTSPPHVFTAQETHPSGIRVTVTITVPVAAATGWPHIRETAEHAQMTASRAMTSIIQSRTDSAEECPF
jgi:hypothetical protein